MQISNIFKFLFLVKRIKQKSITKCIRFLFFKDKKPKKKRQNLKQKEFYLISLNFSFVLMFNYIDFIVKKAKTKKTTLISYIFENIILPFLRKSSSYFVFFKIKILKTFIRNKKT